MLSNSIANKLLKRKIICILMVQYCTETYLFVFSVLMHIEIGMGIVFLFGHVAGHNEETRDDRV